MRIIVRYKYEYKHESESVVFMTGLCHSYGVLQSRQIDLYILIKLLVIF